MSQSPMRITPVCSIDRHSFCGYDERCECSCHLPSPVVLGGGHTPDDRAAGLTFCLWRAADRLPKDTNERAVEVAKALRDYLPGVPDRDIEVYTYAALIAIDAPGWSRRDWDSDCGVARYAVGLPQTPDPTL